MKDGKKFIINYSDSSSSGSLDTADVAGFSEDAGLLLAEDEDGFLLEDDSGLLLADDGGFVSFGFLVVVGTDELKKIMSYRCE